MKSLFFTALCIGLFNLPAINAQTVNINQLESKIEALIPEQVNDTTPGLVIGIVQNGKLIFSKGYGLANMSYNIPNDPKLVYNIGSVSKQFLGYAFAMLHVNGEINIDDPVTKHLKDWPEFKHPVTIRNLLTHTSGYREAYTMSSLAGREIGVDRLSRDECLEVVRKQPELEFIPGSNFTYNSTAWVILAEIFETVAGESAEDWIESNIFNPLNMTDTQIETYVGEVINHAAESYSYNNNVGYTNEKSNRAIFGAADIYTSIQDLTKWINNYRTAEIANNKVNALFLDPFILNDGKNSGYALGIGIGSYKGLKRYRHTGGHEAFITQVSYYPEQDTGIIVISNFGGKGVLSSTKIADILLEEYMTPEAVSNTKSFEIKKDVLAQFEGLYLKSTLNQTLNLNLVDESLMLNGSMKLIPIGPLSFRIDGEEEELKFEAFTDSNYQLTITSGNDMDIYNQVDSKNNAIDNISDYEGDFWSDELETVYHITTKNGKLNVYHRWLGDIPLNPISQDFFGTNYGFYVKFNRNQANKITSLSISSSRTLNVVFKRM